VTTCQIARKTTITRTCRQGAWRGSWRGSLDQFAPVAHRIGLLDLDPERGPDVAMDLVEGFFQPDLGDVARARQGTL
jgi:hypothetical protein